MCSKRVQELPVVLQGRFSYVSYLHTTLLYSIISSLNSIIQSSRFQTRSDKNLKPDSALLNRIFPHSPLAGITILSQTYEVCTFIAHTDVIRPTGPSPKNVVVRLELPSTIPLRTVSTLQKVATLAIPEAVPAVFQIGTAKAEDGREVEFSVSAFVDDAVTLETVWDDLTDHQQSDIMDTVLDAMTKLQRLDLANESVQEILKAGGSGDFFKTAGGEEGVLPSNPNNVALGNRQIGFFSDVPGLLTGIIAYNGVSRKLTVSPSGSAPNNDSNGIEMLSTDKEIPTVLHIGLKELESLQQQAVLCHNDLEPRNLLVRPVHVTDGDGSSVQRYKLAAIIDWEMAGFFPFAYEYVTKDALLGRENLSFSWYSLFKRRTAPLLPAGLAQSSSSSSSDKSQTLFMEAMDRIQRSEGQNTRNVGDLFRERWIRREQLVPGAFPGSGWARRSDASDVRVYRKEDNEALEDEVLEELGLL